MSEGKYGELENESLVLRHGSPALREAVLKLVEVPVETAGGLESGSQPVVETTQVGALEEGEVSWITPSEVKFYYEKIFWFIDEAGLYVESWENGEDDLIPGLISVEKPEEKKRYDYLIVKRGFEKESGGEEIEVLINNKVVEPKSVQELTHPDWLTFRRRKGEESHYRYFRSHDGVDTLIRDDHIDDQDLVSGEGEVRKEDYKIIRIQGKDKGINSKDLNITIDHPGMGKTEVYLHFDDEGNEMIVTENTEGNKVIINGKVIEEDIATESRVKIKGKTRLGFEGVPIELMVRVKKGKIKVEVAKPQLKEKLEKWQISLRQAALSKEEKKKFLHPTLKELIVYSTAIARDFLPGYSWALTLTNLIGLYGVDVVDRVKIVKLLEQEYLTLPEDQENVAWEDFDDKLRDYGLDREQIHLLDLQQKTVVDLARKSLKKTSRFNRFKRGDVLEEPRNKGEWLWQNAGRFIGGVIWLAPQFAGEMIKSAIPVVGLRSLAAVLVMKYGMMFGLSKAVPLMIKTIPVIQKIIGLESEEDNQDSLIVLQAVHETVLFMLTASMVANVGYQVVGSGITSLNDMENSPVMIWINDKLTLARESISAQTKPEDALVQEGTTVPVETQTPQPTATTAPSPTPTISVLEQWQPGEIVTEANHPDLLNYGVGWDLDGDGQSDIKLFYLDDTNGPDMIVAKGETYVKGDDNIWWIDFGNKGEVWPGAGRFNFEQIIERIGDSKLGEMLKFNRNNLPPTGGKVIPIK